MIQQFTNVMLERLREKCFEEDLANESSSKSEVSNSDQSTQYSSHVYGTAVIENCTSKKVDNSIFNPLFGIIDSKDHMKVNVSQIKVVKVKTISQDGGKFRHEIDIVFTVNSRRLVDTPKSYLWKNLGCSNWTLGDGSRVWFTKIHQK